MNIIMNNNEDKIGEYNVLKMKIKYPNTTIFRNTQGLKCLGCGSPNYVFEGQEDKWVCDDCGDEE